MTNLRLGDLFFERTDGLAIVASCNRPDRSLERTDLLDAPGPHVFQKLRPDFCLFDQIENCLGLSLVDRASGSVVIIPDDDDVEDVAGDIPAAQGSCGPPR